MDKWYLSFKYEVTPAAKVLRKRLGQQYNYRKLSESLVVMYDALSTKVSHDGTPHPLRLTDEQWNELFEYTQIYQELDRCLIKIALKPITANEYSGFFSVNTKQ